MCHELTLNGLKTERQKAIPIFYRGIKLDDGYRLDLVIEEQVIVEIKAVLEHLNVKKMLTNRPLSRRISDAGWNEYRRMLEYKTKWYGSKLMIAPQFYPSSKICSICGKEIDKLPLSIRQWQCTGCGTMHDRDLNAAMNLLKLSTGSSPGIDACGDMSGQVKNLLDMCHRSKK